MQAQAPSFVRAPANKARLSWPRHIGLLNDYVRIPHANGSSFASQFLFRELRARGHKVSVIGPSDPEMTTADRPEDCVTLLSGPLRNHPGVRVPLPSPGALRQIAELDLDLTLGQSGSELIDLGVWLRAARGVPFLAVNTIHLPSVYNVMLPDALCDSPRVRHLFDARIIPWLERHSANVYNQGDGLIVLSRGLRRYWQQRGVRVPIHVIPRAVDPRIFGRAASSDPYDAQALPGQRLLCVCRHAREKGITRLLEIFAHYVLPNAPNASLTLVGDGPDHDSFQADARRLGVSTRVFFHGEQPVTRLVDYYRHADLFVYTSLSETYGQVVSEALSCALPVVAFADGMGVCEQVTPGQDGALIPNGPSREQADWRFGSEVVALLRSAVARRELGAQASKLARLRCDPERCMDRYLEAFKDARKHCYRTWGVGRAPSTLQPLVRWSWINATMIAFGLLRAPGTVNRHGSAHPGWMDLDLPAAAQ